MLLPFMGKCCTGAFRSLASRRQERVRPLLMPGANMSADAEMGPYCHREELQFKEIPKNPYLPVDR